MALTLSINSDSKTLELPETTIQRYKFDYAEADNYSKGNTETVRLNITVDVMEILSLPGSNEDNLDLVQNLRDWSQYMHTEKDSEKEYYRNVTLENIFRDTSKGVDIEIREILLSHAYVNRAMESIDTVNGKHTLTLQLLQRGDMLKYAG